jgi:hypothetical protein
VREAVAAGISRVGKEDGEKIWQIYGQRWLQVRRDGIFTIVYFVELLV